MATHSSTPAWKFPIHGVAKESGMPGQLTNNTGVRRRQASIIRSVSDVLEPSDASLQEPILRVSAHLCVQRFHADSMKPAA